MTVFSKLKLADNKKLSTLELSDINEAVSILRETRKFYTNNKNIEANGLWEGNNAELIFEASEKKLFDDFRFYTHLFSGETIATYENDNITPILDDHVLRYLKLSAPLPEAWIYNPPLKMGEVGWDIKGIPVNIDTAYYQEKLSLLYLLGAASYLDEQKNPYILEIGGGYGALARHFASTRIGTYIDIDLTESLLYAAVYLIGTVSESVDIKIYVGKDFKMESKSKFICNDLDFLDNPERSMIVLVPNFLAEELLEYKFEVNLAINTQSLSEMSKKQCEEYMHLICKKIGKKGIFYEQNGNHSEHEGCNTDEILADIFSFVYRSSQLGVGNLSEYYNYPTVLGTYELGTNINIAANFNISEKLQEYQKKFNITVLAKSFEPITRFMTRITMSYPDLSHPDVDPLYEKYFKGRGVFGWAIDIDRYLGDRGLFQRSPIRACASEGITRLKLRRVLALTRKIKGLLKKIFF